MSAGTWSGPIQWDGLYNISIFTEEKNDTESSWLVEDWELTDNPKLDLWGLPYFVDEWGIQTDHDLEHFSTGDVLIAKTITTSKITSGSITGAHITASGGWSSPSFAAYHF